MQSRNAHNEQQQGDSGSSSSWLRRPSIYTGLESSEDIKRQVSEMMAQAFRATEDRVSEVKRRAGMKLSKYFEHLYEERFGLKSVVSRKGTMIII